MKTGIAVALALLACTARPRFLPEEVPALRLPADVQAIDRNPSRGR